MNIFAKSIFLILAIALNSAVLAEGKSNGGDEFRKTAREYEAKAEKYRRKGMDGVSDLYTRQAEIKREAARLGDAGRWDDIDWTEYHENEGKINEMLHGEKWHKKKH